MILFSYLKKNFNKEYSFGLYSKIKSTFLNMYYNIPQHYHSGQEKEERDERERFLRQQVDRKRRREKIFAPTFRIGSGPCKTGIDLS
jgi:hypothetical protein